MSILSSDAQLLKFAETLQDPTEGYLEQALSLANDAFGTEIAILSRVVGDRYEVVCCHAPGNELAAGDAFPLGDTYCSLTLAADDVVSIADMAGSEFSGHPCYAALRLETYIGVPVRHDGNTYGTLNFSASDKRTEDWTDHDRVLIRLMGKWVEHALVAQIARADLEIANRALQASNEELEVFAHAVAHDLREPIRAVNGYLQILERRLDDKLDDRTRSFFAAACTGASRMDEMVTGLRRLTRLATQPVKRVAVELQDAVEQVLDVLRTDISEREAEITVDVQGHIEAEADLIQNLLQNLVFNALKFCGDSPPRIEITSAIAGNSVEIVVRDWGLGISERDRERVFAPFRRAHAREVADGIGMGLTLCRRIVERHSGTIWIGDTDTGTAVHVRLPR